MMLMMHCFQIKPNLQSINLSPGTIFLINQKVRRVSKVLTPSHQLGEEQRSFFKAILCLSFLQRDASTVNATCFYKILGISLLTRSRSSNLEFVGHPKSDSFRYNSQLSDILVTLCTHTEANLTCWQ